MHNDDQVHELVKCHESPKYFINNYVKIINPIHGTVPFILRDYQERLVDHFYDNRYSIHLGARQTGKTITSLSYILWYAIFNSYKKILITSPKHEQSKDLLNQIKTIYENLPKYLRPEIKHQTKMTIEFENGTQIFTQAMSANTGRGMSVSLLYCDNMACSSPKVQDDFWTAIYPCQPEKVIFSSSANTPKGMFYEIWKNRIQLWSTWKPIFTSRHYAPHTESEEFKNEMRKMIGEVAWRREYECEFVENNEKENTDEKYIVQIKNCKAHPSKHHKLCEDVLSTLKDMYPDKEFLVTTLDLEFTKLE